MTLTSSDDARSVARYRAAQAGLVRLLLRDLRGLRRLVSPRRLQPSVRAWIEAATALVEQHAVVAATLAADFYDGERADAAVPGSFTVPLADPPPSEQTTQSLRWATKDLWPRADGDATLVQQEPVDVRLDAAMARAEGVVERLVLNAGRDTMREAVRRDREAVAWARAAALGCCSFCALMASRGATYHTAGTAGREANELFEGEGRAKFHNWCRCTIVPVFRGQRFQLSPHAQEWADLYTGHAQGHSGAQLQIFRRVFREHQQAAGRPTT